MSHYVILLLNSLTTMREVYIGLLGIVHEQKHPCATTSGLGGGGGGGEGGGGGGLPVSFLPLPAFI